MKFSERSKEDIARIEKGNRDAAIKSADGDERFGVASDALTALNVLMVELATSDSLSDKRKMSLLLSAQVGALVSGIAAMVGPKELPKGRDLLHVVVDKAFDSFLKHWKEEEALAGVEDTAKDALSKFTLPKQPPPESPGMAADPGIMDL